MNLSLKGIVGLILATMLAFYIAINHSLAAEDPTSNFPKGSIVDRLDRRIVVGFDQSVDELREALIELDHESIVDHEATYTDFSDIDVGVFFLNQWAEIEQILSAPIFHDFVESAKDDSNSFTKIKRFNLILSGKSEPKILVVYNLRKLKNCSLRDFAQDILIQITINPYDGLENGKLSGLAHCAGS